MILIECSLKILKSHSSETDIYIAGVKNCCNNVANNVLVICAINTQHSWNDTLYENEQFAGLIYNCDYN